MRNRLLFAASAAIVLSGFGTVISGQPRDRSVAMQWRQIGPTRAGRARARGLPSQPNVFYIGFDNGGVWRSTDYGSTWQPIFDDQPTGSIGAIAVAPSDRNIIYVGSGAGIIRPDLAVGDGVYKSTDAGRTWTHLGLRDSQMIAMIDVDPRNPNRLFVAALGLKGAQIRPVHAARRYSRSSPPRRSRRSTTIAFARACLSVASRPSGGSRFKPRCGRWLLKWSTKTVSTRSR
jgi:photosystem II stability/assembly factor-like uncharacterized protein